MYIPKNNKKSCCSSKAYICNKCWGKILENEDTEKCPICKMDLPVVEDIDTGDIESPDPLNIGTRSGREYSSMIDPWRYNDEIRIIQTPPLNNHSLKIMEFFKIIGLMLLFTFVGFISFNIGLFFSVNSLKAQNDELMKIIIYPMFWILMLLSGFFVSLVMLIFYYNCFYKCFNYIDNV
jgi:hypothetical protein